ncbi:hypothetical protein FBU30_003485 [Linnemannia zychae]|nr:hypothetical protein FBU30_003485 [Linnemannia zychae]
MASSLSTSITQTDSFNTRRRGYRLVNNNSNSVAPSSSRTRGRKMAESNRAVSEETESEVEMPRREIFEAVVIINKNDHTHSKNRVDKGYLPASIEDALYLEQDDLFTDMKSSPNAAPKLDSSMISAKRNNGLTLSPTHLIGRRKSQQSKTAFIETNEESHQEKVYEVDDLISRLSLSPPPPPTMFEILEDEYIEEGCGSESGFMPWLMHFDPGLSVGNSPAVKRSTSPDSNLSDQDAGHQNSTSPSSPSRVFQRRERQVNVLGGSDATNFDPFSDDADLSTEIEFEQDKADDDPFGFIKAERQLSRTKNSRSQLMAVNERNKRRSDIWGMNLMRKQFDNSNMGSIGRSSLETSLVERAAARRRGGTNFNQDYKDKGKTSMRGSMPNEDINITAKTSDSIPLESLSEAMDIEKAIRLSLNDLAGVKVGESSGTTAAVLPSEPETTDVTVTKSRRLAENSNLSYKENIDNTTLRTDQSVSRLYDSTHSNFDTDSENMPATTTTIATKNDAPDDILILDDPFSPPSTPPRKTAQSNSSIDVFHQLVGSDEQSPIILETTPTKKPEAGMPSSYESPESNKNHKGKRSKPKKFMRVELLEAMLPRPRNTSKVLPRNSRTGRNKDNVFILESDTSHDSDSDVSKDESGEEEEEEEVLVRRYHYRSTSSAKAHDVANTSNTSKAAKTTQKGRIPNAKPTATKSNQKRKAQAPATTTKSTNKRQKSTLVAKPETKVKAKDLHKEEKKDERINWTKEQWKAHEERIHYFEQVDDFELDVETVR